MYNVTRKIFKALSVNGIVRMVTGIPWHNNDATFEPRRQSCGPRAFHCGPLDGPRCLHTFMYIRSSFCFSSLNPLSKSLKSTINLLSSSLRIQVSCTHFHSNSPSQNQPHRTEKPHILTSSITHYFPTPLRNTIMPIRLSEPHPTASPKMTFGRGGAGNATRPPQPLPPTTTVTSRLTTTTPQSSSHSSSNHKFTTGRGGAGNLHASTDERPMFRFDEELERERLKEVAPVYHVGRGGSGNAVKERDNRRGSDGSAFSSASTSSSSGGSSARGSVEWVRGLVKKI